MSRMVEAIYKSDTLAAIYEDVILEPTNSGARPF